MKNIEAYITRAIQRGEPFAAGPGYGQALTRDWVFIRDYEDFTSTCYQLHGVPVCSYMVSKDSDQSHGDLILFTENMSRLHAERLRSVARAFEVPGVFQQRGAWYWEDTSARVGHSRLFQITDKPIWPAKRPDYHLEAEG